MKFSRELPVNLNIVRSYDATSVRVRDQELRSSCLLDAQHLIVDWAPHTVDSLQIEHFSEAWNWQPEILLLGTGVRQVLPMQQIYAAILSRGVAFEVMDTGGACRTYNVLISESRRVALGLLF